MLLLMYLGVAALIFGLIALRQSNRRRETGEPEQRGPWMAISSSSPIRVGPPLPESSNGTIGIISSPSVCHPLRYANGAAANGVENRRHHTRTD